ncbi:MAG: MFS transporter [Candidatus Saccharimonadales bacterium]
MSLFTDIATEMLYPIMPLYLSDIGYGIVLIGFIEGLAQVFTGVLKLLSGVYSDKIGKRKGLVNAGYGMSAVSKPLRLSSQPTGLYLVFVCLIGSAKVLETLLEMHCLPIYQRQLTVLACRFGFHRSLDTVGATLGPLITLAILYSWTDNISLIIALTAIPGACAVIASWFIRERKLKKTKLPTAEKGGVRSLLQRLRHFYQNSSPSYKKVLVIILSLALIKSVDIYLLLRARELGLSNMFIISAYILYNFVGVLVVYQMGTLSDKYGFGKVFGGATLFLSLSYMLLSQNELPLVLIFAAFAAYAVFQSAFEGLASSWISLHTKQADQATGIGLMLGLQAVASFVSVMAVGGLWVLFGAKVVFAVVALFALMFGIYLFFTSTRDYVSKVDHGRTPYAPNIAQLVAKNTNFRTTVWTGANLQVTLMTIPPGDDIGLEAHKSIDQLLYIIEGKAKVQMGDREDTLDFEQNVKEGFSVMVPANTFHNIINNSKSIPLKLFSVYAAPEHDYGTIHKTASEADVAELTEFLEDD